MQPTWQDVELILFWVDSLHLSPYALIAALTGVLGALPMAINPGPGAVIYRGLATVSVGGVALSLLFTVVLVPALLRLAARRTPPVAASSMHRALPPHPVA